MDYKEFVKIAAENTEENTDKLRSEKRATGEEAGNDDFDTRKK